MKKTLISMLTIFSILLPFAALKADDHPTKEEVVSFVEEGEAFVKKHGKEAFFKEIMNDKGIFKRGELYFYAYDFEGTVVSHGAQPELVGKNLINFEDKNGFKLIAALRDAAATGGGWVKYYWDNPVSKKMEKKIGYVTKIDDTCWFGSGTYVSE
ncbi:MAG: cache domain-containing protein [Candidatus Theseobacter exili]|nr:cache domain-containing protein [Candidatus Theseobacter exili]